MKHNEVNPNEAPDGFVAIPDRGFPCVGCYYQSDGDCPKREYRLQCEERNRQDRWSVIFVKKEK